MIERKRFLELCRENAINENSVIVMCDNIKYHPISLNIWFTDYGEVRNTAILHDINADCVLSCNIEKLCELTN